MRDRSVILSHSGSSRNSGVHSRRLGPPASGGRAPIGGGRFYPARRAPLRDLVDQLLDAVDVPEHDRLAPAYLVPHGGYGESGPVAAEVYARLRLHGDRIERVILLGPRHHPAGTEPVAGCVAPNATSWSTPLGRTPIDSATIRALLSDGHLSVDDHVHAGEHALEVQLPFVQAAVPHAMVLPVLVGPAAVDDVVVTLLALADLNGAVVLVTSDLGSADTIGRTLLSVLEMAPERLGNRDACGVHALRGVLGWANHRRLRAELLARRSDHVAFAFVDPSTGS